MAVSADYIKDPDAILDYSFDWTAWLPVGDTISTSTFITTAGITTGTGANGAPAPTHTTTNTTVWLIGGNSGQPYLITNRIVTALGRTDDRSITVRVQNR